LAEDAFVYRAMLQEMIWANLRARQWAAARELIGLSAVLLPRRADRIAIRFPRRLLARLGM
jgi:hypothetical protein